ncbi:glycosyltransferase [Rugamonas rubra]|nr:nucleotide disphospho-sugar-binding domain-containing protein [Rugamonas rubra]
MMERKKILFVAEAVTLAHLARPLALAAALEPARFMAQLACADGYEQFLGAGAPPRWRIHSVAPAQFLAALAAGRPVYEVATLRRYVEDDLHLFQQAKPDLVVGDFRLSLSISARRAGLPYVALSNAYWSPYVPQHYPLPDIPLARLRPLALASALFQLARPLAFALHTRPLNRVRRQYGMASLGWDLRRVYTDADRTLYADVAELFPPRDMPASHSYLGPVAWSPPLAPPPWWAELPADVPLVYVTLGSSGQQRLLPLVLQALAPLPVLVAAATAGRAAPPRPPANARIADYLPGGLAARRARLVVCNGGSLSSQQALAAGVPVLGIAGNLDQFLNMRGIVAAGAGAVLRADRAGVAELRRTCEILLREGTARAAAGVVAQLFRRYDAGASFNAVLRQMLGMPA